MEYQNNMYKETTFKPPNYLAHLKAFNIFFSYMLREKSEYIIEVNHLLCFSRPNDFFCDYAPNYDVMIKLLIWERFEFFYLGNVKHMCCVLLAKSLK